MSCETVAAEVWEEKHPDATLDYAADFEKDCSRLWDKWQDFATGTRIRVFRPGHASGYEMEATTGGRSGGRHPTFPTAGTLTEGSVTWTPRAISSASLLRTIVGTPTWVADSGVTVSAESLSDQKAIAKIAGGTDGVDYSVTVTAIGSDGLVMVKVGILPVRVPVRVCA